MFAHVAEVRNLTGLGDVCAQHNGGVFGENHRRGTRWLPTEFDIPAIPVHWRYFSKIRTSEILADHDRHERINRSADRALAKIEASIERHDAITFAELVTLALDFAKSRRAPNGSTRRKKPSVRLRRMAERRL